MNKFFVVATPIGNLGDITLRALEVLKSVDLILCEDTRVTRRLLVKYDIKTPMMSVEKQSEKRKTQNTIQMLQDGKSLALVSDAGTPTISDPGAYLIARIRDECPRISIESIPGASAVTGALSISGFPSDQFLFLGFLPHKKGRETLFKEIKASKRTVVFYESPHRILKTLVALEGVKPPLRGFTPKKLFVARELTKIHEESLIGTASDILVYFKNNPDKVRGEFVVVACPEHS